MYHQKISDDLLPRFDASTSLACEPGHHLISDMAILSPAGHPDVMLMLANYHLSSFSDHLFSELAIPLPVHLNRAVTKRRAEYLASRVCVRHALSLTGIDGFILHNDANRAPIWPPGIVGSLSHTDSWIGLIVGQSSCAKLLGVDCEWVIPQARAHELQKMIISTDEKNVLQQSGLADAVALTVAFSLKESLYKALFPRIRQFMDFKDAEIVASNADASRVCLRLVRHFPADFPAGRLFTGHVLIQEDRVLSWIVTPLNASDMSAAQHLANDGSVA
ncbi:4'-phosphopantetheinyl transferase superfamily protein [Erwinia psidii]|nr:4'-phosphopantetheinyl transferase superfamily protein [Erwinia psidii]